MQNQSKGWLYQRGVAMVAVSALLVPIIVGCGDGNRATEVPGPRMPPVDDSRAMRYGNPGGNYGLEPRSNPRRGITTGQKVAILAGAAALYYMYKKNQAKKESGELNGEPVYYLSKNGRVYYRDSTGRAHWVTPPPEGIRVPMEESLPYRDFQGYNNSTNGLTLERLGAGRY